MAQPKAQRQDELLKVYEFTCECTACVNNYPMPNKLRKIDKTFVLPRFGKFPADKYLMEELRNDLKFIDENIETHPSFETAAVLLRVKELLRTVCERVSFPF